MAQVMITIGTKEIYVDTQGVDRVLVNNKQTKELSEKTSRKIENLLKEIEKLTQA